ncbi:hypothetical protein FB45DRAFT_564386 [Roridomyces roridus]|uniref:Uncharacterized protein n=1 Tax=Roridomyces roridus TaxID=1738132 RepID=A0AAD7F6C5_9AGAR|nr:hypothetical protein FB45DRAFT_564386 [Roridomyces roridus]
MAGFLRKKTAPPPAPSPPQQPVTNGAPATPLFARFATSSDETSPQRIVSSPMALATRKEQPPGISNAGIRGAQAARQNVVPSYPQNQAGPASNGKSNSYASPVQKRRASPPARTQTLPPTASVQPPQNRRFSHVPGIDKPLPTILPDDNYSPDPLGTTPPQSSLPANRRASSRGYPPAAIQNFSNGRVMNTPAQSPPSSPPTRPFSDANTRLGTRPLAQAPPNPNSASLQSSSRYPKEFQRQDLRHKLSDASVASGRPPAIPVPSSPPRQAPPVQWDPEPRAPAGPSFDQVNIHSFFLYWGGARICMDPVIAS